MQQSTPPKVQQIAPLEIEAESFRIIESELGPTNFDVEQFQVVRRMIHATGDFQFSQDVRFHPDAMAAAHRAISQGKDILVDVNMARQGVSKPLLKRFGSKVICRVADPEAAQLAKEKNLTRSEAAIELAATDNIGIVAIGNAPTALLKTMALIEAGVFKPDLIIGVPVGFVNAVESKAILVEKGYPFITVLGRKGGTPVNVATLNALLRLPTPPNS